MQESISENMKSENEEVGKEIAPEQEPQTQDSSPATDDSESTDNQKKLSEPKASTMLSGGSAAADGADAAADEGAPAAADAGATPEDADAEEAAKSKKLDYSYTQNRELSWLQFDRRVLEEALDESVPLLERMKFISIFCTNLDEFFMVRVGSLMDLSIIAPEIRENKTNMTPVQQLEAIYEAVRPLVKERDKIYAKVSSELREYGFKELDYESLAKKDRKFARDYYREFIRPVLSPQVVDERHPFPHLRNKELYVVTQLSEEDGSQHLGIVPVPDNIQPLVFDPDNPLHFVRAEKLIAGHIKKIFEIYETSDPYIICVTRNADISFDEEKFSDDEGDYRLHVSRLLKKRNRLNPVRLEVEGKLDKELLNGLLKRLKLNKNQVYTYSAPINLDWAFGLDRRVSAEDKKKLSYNPFIPRVSKEFDPNKSIISQIEERDRLLFYPYDSIDPFLRMLQEAAVDPDVLSIKITVYRLASESRVAQHLIDAAENGKEVTVLMELRARFDEANNIDWSARLEDAGCNIIYGMENYKCHSKVCLITKRSKGGVTYITQIGTGNYNEKTARLYTDLSLMTSDPIIGQDAMTFFQNMLIGNLNGDYEKLLVAPVSIKRTILKLIDREIAKGTDGRITLKCNSLTERDIIDRLALASQAGVQIRMNIRGICCMLPGIEGKTENVHVRSVVGQFLEHSRIFVFGEGEDMQMYVGSADLMTRNLCHRVEVAVPITTKPAREAIMVFLDKIFADNTKARVLEPSGKYKKVCESRDKDMVDCTEEFSVQEWCIEHPLQDEKPEAPAPLFKRVKDAIIKQDKGVLAKTAKDEDAAGGTDEEVESAAADGVPDLASLAQNLAGEVASLAGELVDDAAAFVEETTGKKDKKYVKADEELKAGKEPEADEPAKAEKGAEDDQSKPKHAKASHLDSTDKLKKVVVDEKDAKHSKKSDDDAPKVKDREIDIPVSTEKTADKLERERNFASGAPHVPAKPKDPEAKAQDSSDKDASGAKANIASNKPAKHSKPKKSFFRRLFS